VHWRALVARQRDAEGTSPRGGFKAHAFGVALRQTCPAGAKFSSSL
jgi:hypothetical protein